MIPTLLKRFEPRLRPMAPPPAEPLPEMVYVNLGQTGLQMSVAGLGGGGHSRLGLSTGNSQANAIAVVQQAIDWGINSIDTAEAYGTEAVIGRAIRSIPRDRLILSTKKQPMDKKGQMISPKVLTRSLDRSLKALKTDYIDIYHLHGVKPKQYDTVVPALLPTLERLKAQGKIRCIGVTESFTKDPSHQMLARAVNDNCWDVIMVGFNCINQTAKQTILPKAADKGIGVLGMFAVRNALRSPAKLKSAVETLKTDGVIASEQSASEMLTPLLESSDVTSVPDLAYRYCRYQPGIDVVMFGTGRFDHLYQNIASLLRAPLPDEITQSLEQIFSPVTTFTGN